MHLRDRFLNAVIKHRWKVHPIVGVLGARQTGKTTLLREILGKQNKIPYFTLDRPELLKQIKSRPESFILTETDDFSKQIIIDEAHKAPKIFDVLKVLADEKRTRGIVTITGSVDFVSVRGVRETLTGRIGLCRLFPMTVAEVLRKPLGTFWKNRKKSKNIAVEAWIKRGGMPGFCALGNDAERSLVIDDWILSVCERDLPVLKGARLEGYIAREVLSQICADPERPPSKIAAEIGEDTRTVHKHLSALESLFVIHRVRPLTTGFDRFYVLDAGVAGRLGASDKTKYTILMINEVLAQHEYLGLPRPSLFHHTSRGTTKVELVIKSQNEQFGFAISDHVEITRSKVRSLESDRKLFSTLSVLAPVVSHQKLSKDILLEPFSYYC